MYPQEYSRHLRPAPEQDEDVQPFHRQVNETEHAFRAFEIYAELGFSRTLEKTALRVYGDRWEGQLRHVERWADDFRWKERAQALDVFIEKHHTDYEDQQRRRSRYKVAKALPDITDVAVEGALGRRKIDRTQGALIMNLMKDDRAGKGDINIHIEAPPLPKEVAGQIDAEDAQVLESDSLHAEADKLRPTFDS